MAPSGSPARLQSSLDPRVRFLYAEQAGVSTPSCNPLGGARVISFAAAGGRTTGLSAALFSPAEPRASQLPGRGIMRSIRRVPFVVVLAACLILGGPTISDV